MWRVLRSKIFLAVAVAAIVLVGMGLGRVILQNRALAGEVAELQAESASLSAKNAEFLELAKRFESDSFVEREARLKFNLQKPGEQTIAVKRVGESATSSAVAAVREEENLSRWWRYFFNPDSLIVEKI